jgi:hypothetical protein
MPSIHVSVCFNAPTNVQKGSHVSLVWLLQSIPLM